MREPSSAVTYPGRHARHAADRRAPRRRVVSHLGVMVAVAALMGVLVAGLAIPFAALAGFGARTVADSMDKLPDDLTAEPLAQRTRVLAADGSLLATFTTRTASTCRSTRSR